MNEKKENTTEHRERASRSDEATIGAEETLGHGNVPDVDTAYAATIQVSKLKGKWLMWMVSNDCRLRPVYL